MKRQPLVDYDTYPHLDVTPRDLAAFLHCDPRTILRMIETHALSAFRVGRHYRIPISEARRMFPVKQHRDTSRDMSGKSKAMTA